ncbi:diacylglycerol kinase family protein [Paenibacillus assamensis]|uniref:diacylglycerol kinase family protein n=1 Tax=Paenibacillus assamensis TaxID=311244 RepID=UPI000417D3EF|nr:diacylglycerol kinase family protein [Paenibacillus assamensis]
MDWRHNWRRTFQAAIDGIKYAYATQRNMRVHLFASIIVILLGILLGVNTSEWLWLLLSITVVIAAELINTAIEAVVDMVMPDQHPLAKIAKDTAAGAVLVTAAFAVITGVTIFGGRFVSVIGTL